jgi:myosin heavy subunit
MRGLKRAEAEELRKRDETARRLLDELEKVEEKVRLEAEANKIREEAERVRLEAEANKIREEAERVRLEAEENKIREQIRITTERLKAVTGEEMTPAEVSAKDYQRMVEERNKKREDDRAALQNANRVTDDLKIWQENQAKLQMEERRKREKQFNELAAASRLEIEEREKQREKERQERLREQKEKLREQKEKGEQHREKLLEIHSQMDELKTQMEGNRETKTVWNAETGRYETTFAEKSQPTRMVTRSSSRERTLSNLPGTDLENTVLGNQASSLRRRMSTTSIPDQIPPRSGIRNQAHDKRNYLKPNSIEEMRQELKRIKPMVTIEPGNWIDETFANPAIPGWTKLSSFDPISKGETLQYLFYRANTEADQSSEIFKNLMAVLRKSGKIRVAPIVPGPSSRRASLQGSSPSLVQPPPAPSPRRDSHLGLGINRQVGQGLGHQNDYNLSHLSRKRPITDLYDYEDCYHHVSDGFSLAPHLSKYSRHF